MEGNPSAGEISTADIETFSDSNAENLKQPDVSDETFDHPCQPCLDEDKNIESKKYCLECCEFLCETCINYHKKFKATKTHELINKTDVKPKIGKQLLDECFQHSGKHIELFCKSHNQLCCSTCRDVYHDECDGVVAIADAASNVSESQELNDIVDELDNAQTELENVIKKREQDGERIDSEEEVALKALESTREKVMEILNQLKLLNENKIIMKRAELLKTNIHEDLDKCNKELTTLKDTLTVLKDCDEDNVNKFTTMKRAKQNIIIANTLSEITHTKAGGESLVFSENSEIIKNFLTFKQFGKIQNVAGIKTISTPTQVNIALEEEQSVQIESMCDMQQHNNAFLITDSVNSNLKAINPSGQIDLVKTFYKEPGEIRKLISISSERSSYALSFPKANLVKIFSEGYKYDKRRYTYNLGGYIELKTITTRSPCNGLAFHNSSLYIACAGLDRTSAQGQGYIDIYTTDAKHLKSITCDANGRPLTCSPYRIASYQNSEHMYVLDCALGLLKFTKQTENKLTVTKLPKFEKGGMDVNEKGHVFVLDYVGNKINLFGPNDVEVGPILSEIDGIVKPTAVMYTGSTRKLYVALENCSEVLVFDIVYDS